MATYYNGQEIKSTSKMSGLSLVGRTSVKIGGIDVNLSTRPRLDPVRLFDGGKIPDPETACLFGEGGTPLDLYSSEPPVDGVFLFEDSAGNIPFDGGNAYYYEPINNVVYQIDSGGRILTSSRCGR